VKTKEVLEPKDYMQYTIYEDVLARERLRAIIDRVSAYAEAAHQAGLRILDLGCGIGGITFPLGYLGHNVVGVDVDSRSIEECNRRNTFPNATYLVGDIENLDLGEKFDVAICSEVLEHSPRPERILETIRKHLNPNGIAIVTVPNGYSFYELVFSRLFQKLGITVLFHKLPNKMYKALTGSPSPYHSLNIFCGHVQFFTFSRFKRLLSKCGFQVLDAGNLGMGLFLDWRWLRYLKRVECKLADFVPHFLAGLWVFVLSRSAAKQMEKR